MSFRFSATTLTVLIVAASLNSRSFAVDVPLVNNSFEDPIDANNASVDERGSTFTFNPTPGSGYRLLSNVDNSVVGDSAAARLSSATVPGWQLFQSGNVDNTDPRGFDDDKGGFEGTIYAYSNEGNDIILWSDLTAATVSAGDWVTVTWSAASDRMNETLQTAAYLSFDGGTPTNVFFTGQTGQGNATTVGAYGQYDGTLAGNAGNGEAPGNYETYSQTLQINAAEAAAVATSGGLRVGIQGWGDRGQMRIDNIFLDVSPAPSVTPTVLIGGAIGNGNFADLTGAVATGTGAVNDSDPTAGGGSPGIRFSETGDGNVSIPGWTIDSVGTGGVDDDSEGTGGANDPYVFGVGNSDADVISDRYGQSLTFSEGDVLRLSYSQARDVGTAAQDFEAFFDFDGAGTDTVSVGEGAYDVSQVGTTAAAFETETFLYTLTADDAANANANGVGVVLDADNALTPGDFDGDGDVDGADLAQWEGDYGVNGESDADSDGDSDGQDFLEWQRNAGRGVWRLDNVVLELFSVGAGTAGALSTVATVPEPCGFVLLLAGGLPLLLARKRFK